MAKARGLGRGLSSLIPSNEPNPSVQHESPQNNVAHLAISVVTSSPYQPRKHFDDQEINELAQSIRVHGVIQPVVVRPAGDFFELVAGERRYRAAKIGGLEEIPALIRPMSDQEAMEIALVENLQRRDLDPIEESSAYLKLIEQLGWTQENLSQRVGKSRSHIANYLRLLALGEEIQEWISQGSLSVAHGKYLLSVDEPRRSVLARRTVLEGWTLRQLQDFAERAVPQTAAKEPVDVHLSQAQENLSRLFGAKVRLRGGLSKGRIEIPYHTVEELERILDIIQEGDQDGPGNFVV